jgi:hypothetical protein
VPWWPFTSAITPLYEGLRFMRSDDLRVLAIENILVSLALASIVALALSTRRRWLVLVAQLTIAFYWLSGALLVGVTTG